MAAAGRLWLDLSLWILAVTKVKAGLCQQQLSEWRRDADAEQGRHVRGEAQEHHASSLPAAEESTSLQLMERLSCAGDHLQSLLICIPSPLTFAPANNDGGRL